MFNRIRITGGIVLLLFSFIASAEGNFENACANIEAVGSASYFKDFETQIYNAKIIYCEMTQADVPNYPNSFVLAANHLKLIGAREDDLTKINEKLKKFIDSGRMPQMTIASESMIVVNLEQAFEVISDIANCDSKAKAIKQNGSCVEAITEFINIYNNGQAFYSLDRTLVTKAQFESVKAQWDVFLEQSRSQTLLELAFNGWLYKDSETASFKRPPSGQWILLHPGIVIENVSDAIDGSQTDEALALDVIGYNKWTQDKWYIPSGISYTLLYSDRPNIKDVRNAVSIHFSSKYMLGYSRRDGVDGWFVSIDLLEVLKDKKESLDAYTSNF